MVSGGMDAPEWNPTASLSAIKLGPRRIFQTRVLCLRPGLYSKIYRNSVSHKAILLHLINSLIISALTARAAGRAEAFLAGQMPCHAFAVAPPLSSSSSSFSLSLSLCLLSHSSFFYLLNLWLCNA